MTSARCCAAWRYRTSAKLHTSNGAPVPERVFELGSRALWPRALRERAIPFMAELLHETRAIAHLAFLHEGDVLYVEKFFGHGALPCPTRVGGRNPAHATALGKSILSYSSPETVGGFLSGHLSRATRHTVSHPEALYKQLRVAREEGVAVEIEQFRVGLACVAAPILDRRTGEAVAALSISSATARFDKRRFAARVRRAADALSQSAL